MNLVLITGREILAISFGVFSLLLIVFIFSSKKDMNLEKKNNSGSNKPRSLGADNSGTNTNLKLKERQLTQKEIAVLDILIKHFSDRFVIMPKVPLHEIIAPKASRVFYDVVADTVLDFVFIDKKTLRPILVVDVFDNSFGDESLTEVAQHAATAIKSVRLHLVSIQIRDSIVEDKIVGMIAPVVESKSSIISSPFQSATSMGSATASSQGSGVQNAEVLKNVEIAPEAKALKNGEGILINAGSLKDKK